MHALIGLRHSWYKDAAVTAGATDVTRRDVQQSTPNAGLVYDVTKAISVYGSFSRAFAPQQASVETVSGSILPPQLTKRYEFGLKSDFFNDRLDINGSVYRYTTSNYAIVDPNNPFFFLSAAGIKAKGVELSAVGSITPDLKITAGYAYATGEIGGQAQLDQSPRNVANLWVIKSFSLPNGNKIGVGLGGNFNDGFYLTDNVKESAGAADFTTLFDHTYLSLDASVSYTLGTWMMNLTGDNLTGRLNYALSGGTFQLERAPPRTVRFVVDKKF